MPPKVISDRDYESLFLNRKLSSQLQNGEEGVPANKVSPVDLKKVLYFLKILETQCPVLNMGLTGLYFILDR